MQRETLLDLIQAGDTARLGDFFYTSAAKAKGTVKVRPADVGWEDHTLTADKFQRAETDPADIDEAMRWCVLVSDIPECDGDTAAFMYLDGETGSAIIAALSGPAHDHAVAIRMVARDLRAEQTEAPARKTVTVEAAPEPRKAANDNKPKFASIDAETLLGMEFAPIKYVIPGYVAEGLTLLGGRPKLGKSWLALDFGVAVASGGRSLGAECEQGDALYLALEDNQRRLQDRLRVVLPRFKRPDMSRLSLLTEAPKIGAGLIEMLDKWRQSVPDPRLIIVDTLAIVRPPKGKNQDSYAADYEALSPLQRFASEHRLAVVVVTHVRKAEAEDPLEMISGTNGLTGAADSIMILNRTTDGPKLYGRGRDVEEVEKALKFDGGRWSVLGDVDDVKRSGERKQIMEALAAASGPMTPAEIVTATGMKLPNVNYLLRKMVAAGEAEKQGYGSYVSTPQTPMTPQSSSSHYPPMGTKTEESEDSEGGTLESEVPDCVPTFLRRAA
ncbi:AAA family ATPase [Mesorhizobium sp. WSM3626]|uniref:AAA family ATPase n=1 Tax=Mesorhizobium sp. WSM3626 TaxID=1040987 RepID=UPI0004B65635|nr:AAA family ATPase [Mesorhizobium sp. WSM3626]